MRKALPMEFAPQIFRILGIVAIAFFVVGCPSASDPPAHAVNLTNPATLQCVYLADSSVAVSPTHAVSLAAARNEWTSFTVQASLPTVGGYSLQLHSLDSGGATIPVSNFTAYQVLTMPADMDRAGYVRHTGLPSDHRKVPRALLPQAIDSNGILNLAASRNPLHPADPRSHAGGPGSEPVTLWFDLHIPKGTPAGDYTGNIYLTGSGARGAIVALPLHVTVYDFDLPDERHLQMVGRLNWDRLEKLYPAQFETFTPSWVNRREGRYQPTVRTLDHLVALAQENRATLVVPALKPIVKWPAGEGPLIDWGDFDSMIRPWFSGDAFADHVGLGFWPLPEAELLDRYDRPSQLQYWSSASVHFDSNGWLDRSAVSLDPTSAGRANPDEVSELCRATAELLKCHPSLRVLIPLEDQQIEFATPDSPALIDPRSASRLLTAGATLVSGAPTPAPNEQKSRHWLRTDLAGLVPYFGAGSNERDVRVWAWLAFLRHLDSFGAKHVFEPNFILWDSALPHANSPDEPADPGEVAWFYPGKWFGVDLPVATVQLKWLRRAQQDYEYLLLAQQRGEVITALQMARLLTKPVELEASRVPDPVYAMMTGSSNPQAWDDAQRLVADIILLRKPGNKIDPVRQQELYLRTLQLSAREERPLLIGRSAKWNWTQAPAGKRERGKWVNLDFGLDIYNASETTPDQNHIRWSHVPAGWHYDPHEVDVPRLETYHLQSTTLHQQFNLDQTSPASREPIELQFINGFDHVVSPLKIMLPVASIDRREGRLALDGNLEDWTAADMIHDGPLVRMYNRPAVQSQTLQLAATHSTVFSSWGNQNFYLAFALEGLSPGMGRRQNFVDYQDRRAWGEDLCEILIQPIGINNKPGAVLHLVCKPTGGVWLERKRSDAADGASSWQPLDSTTVRYAAKVPDTAWTGEVAIPWSAILTPDEDRPALLRFNFVQHKASTGESATWAGPVDFGRDDAFMGLLYLRVPGARDVTDFVRKER